MGWLGKQRGDTLVEVAMAIAILATVMVTAFQMSGESIRLGFDSREHTQAINIAQQQGEALRWFADTQMQNGTSLLATTPGTLLSTCAPTTSPTSATACNMSTGANPVPNTGMYDCSTYVIAGCEVEIQSLKDITMGHTGPYPEIDELITVTWPTALGGTATCLNTGVADCDSVSLDERLADTTDYAPIDCSVAGTPGCTPAVGGPGPGGGAPLCPAGYVGSPPICSLALSISPSGSQQQFAGTSISIQVYNAGGVSIANTPVYLLESNGTCADPTLCPVTQSTSTYSFNTTYPGGTWTVEACPTATITPECSSSLTITQESYTLNTPLFQYFNGLWWFYTTAPYYIEPGGTDPSYIPEGNVGYLAPAGSNRPNLIPLNRSFNTITGDHYYYTTQYNPRGAGWQFEEVQGYLLPLGPSQTCPTAGTTQLYQWYDEGPSQGDGYGYFLSTTSTNGLAGNWSKTGVIGCIFTGP